MRLTRCKEAYKGSLRKSQRGQIVLFTVLLLLLVGTLGLYTTIRPSNATLEDNVQTERALAQAKEALIAYASGQPTSARPGALPCPDKIGNGTTGSSCNTTSAQIGRLPWKTLGIPDLRDGSGEGLWYAVSSNFKYNSPVSPLNSNTLGQLTVTGIAPANNVIAIVFAPGTALTGQFRISANTNKVEHYLDGENANGDTIFTTAAASNLFNDRLLAITPAMFFPRVEMYVARRARIFLNAYYNVLGYFPLGTSYGTTGPCVGSTQGRIPMDPEICNIGSGAWPTSVPVAPWFWTGNDDWDKILFYAVAPACVYPALNCTGTGGLLTVNGTTNARAIVISPGTAYAGQNRPCTSLADCLEPPNTTSFPNFTHSSVSVTRNDRVIIVAP